VAPRRVVTVVFPQLQALDLVGPMEVFSGASRLLARTRSDDPGYSVSVASHGGGLVPTSSGLALATEDAETALRPPVDTLIVAGGEGSRAAVRDDALVALLRLAAPRARRVASVCTGAFLLAGAGLLDGRRAVTHWASCDALSRLHPGVQVERDPIYVRDGNVYTSAGVTAGMDLALALVEEDLGHEVALTVARWLVLFLHRPGNQSQFSTHLSAQLADHQAIRELQGWMAGHLAADLSVEALAERAAMSPRNFARCFRREVGTTPARYVETLRLEAARRRLEESRQPIEGVAAGCGFGTAETMRRAFIRALGTGPAEYRRRFQLAGPLSA
jgi:transcriptional regulator GlxA family with amidase domain